MHTHCHASGKPLATEAEAETAAEPGDRIMPVVYANLPTETTN